MSPSMWIGNASVALYVIERGRNMQYRIITDSWDQADKDIRIGDGSVPAASAKSWTPDIRDCFGELGKKTGDAEDEPEDSVIVDGRTYEVKRLGDHNIFHKDVAWVQAEDIETGTIGYILVTGFNPVPVLIPLAAAAVIGLAVIIIPHLHLPAKNTEEKPGIEYNEADQEKTNNPNREQHAIIGSYSSYESVADQTWKAGETHQKIQLSLPKTVTIQGKDGENVSYTNPIEAAPHVYIDFNKDGSYTDDECVYNPIERDDEGNITKLGSVVKPGNSITEIELTKPLDAGEYDAEVLWTGITTDTQQLANPMSFLFHITVE